MINSINRESDIMKEISLVVTPKGTSAFFPLLQGGFTLKVLVGCSIKDLLCGQFNIAPDYVEERISTVFLDARPVDKVESAFIINGSKLALSGAMPGLVGATFRRGGPISSFRSSITHRNETVSRDTQEGFIVLKLFNLLIKELGPIFLKQGIWIQNDKLHAFVKQLPDKFSKELKEIEIDGRRTNLKKIAESHVKQMSDSVQLKILTYPEVERHN